MKKKQIKITFSSSSQLLLLSSSSSSSENSAFIALAILSFMLAVDVSFLLPDNLLVPLLIAQQFGRYINLCIYIHNILMIHFFLFIFMYFFVILCIFLFAHSLISSCDNFFISLLFVWSIVFLLFHTLTTLFGIISQSINQFRSQRFAHAPVITQIQRPANVTSPINRLFFIIRLLLTQTLHFFVSKNQKLEN